MTIPADRRRMLGAFLRSRREAIGPESSTEPGLPRARRRTPGLRREEVAQRCGISAAWYAWIEQGRDIAVSAASLGRLAEALRLTAAERAYLFELARQRDPVSPGSARSAPEPVPETVLARLRAIAAPADLLDRVWRARAWNRDAGRLFAPWLASGEPCLLRFLFLDPAARTFVCDYEERATRVIAEFRADTAREADDPEIRALVEELRLRSSDFARLWGEHDVLTRDGGLRSFLHPQDGRSLYEQITAVPAAFQAFRLVVLMPFGR